MRLRPVAGHTFGAEREPQNLLLGDGDAVEAGFLKGADGLLGEFVAGGGDAHRTGFHVGFVRDAVDALRAGGGTVALVPTMGALHAGHMALVAEARRQADHVVASIFVNPTQFGASEDLNTYPRREAGDAAMLEAEGCDILWAPDVETMYPDGPKATLRAGAAAGGLDGAARPGHFDGVVTVVARLFAQVRPDVALFGEKDYQQLAVIREMVRDQALPVEIVGVPTQRDADGLVAAITANLDAAVERLTAPQEADVETFEEPRPVPPPRLEPIEPTGL